MGATWQQRLYGPRLDAVSGNGGLCRDEFIRFRPICFCDIPEVSLRRHTRFYGRFGIAFRKDFLVSKGANPVFYVAKGSLAKRERQGPPPLTLKDIESDPHAAFRNQLAAMDQEPIAVRRCEFFDRLVETLMGVLPPPWPSGTPADASDPVREIQQRVRSDLVRHVFAFMKFFDESLADDDEHNFYMEREWRVAGFVPFELTDVQSVYVASGFRDRVQRECAGIRIVELES